MKSKRFYPAVFILAFFVSSCTDRPNTYKEIRLLLGTYVTVKASDPEKNTGQIKEAVGRGFLEIKRVDGLLSSFKEGNIIDRINNSATGEVLLDEETFYILERAKHFFDISKGAFDITVLPLMELWGFHRKNYSVPEEAQIREALDKTGSEKMVLDREKRSVRFLKEGMKIDLGGIATGYAVDRAVSILKDNGLENALIDAGGDIYCLGRADKNRKWSVGIRDPLNKTRIIKRLELENEAITTSGVYEKYFEKNGKRYSHVMDPRTGYPVQDYLQGVSVIAKDCLTADALATALMVAGKEKGNKIIKGLPGVKAIFTNLAN